MSSISIDTNASADQSSEGDSSLLMAELSISHAGRHYHFDGYRYERLADAVAYARLVGARHSEQSASPPMMKVDPVAAPNAAETQLMRELSISFENGSFVFAGFRYDRLIDAANYARHHPQLSLQAF